MERREFPEEEFETVDLADYIAVIRERKWIILLSTLLVVAATLAFSLTRTPQYRSTAELLYQPLGMESTLLGGSLFPTVRADDKIPADARLIESPPVATPAAELLGDGQDAAELLEQVDTSVNLETDVIEVTAVSTDPDESAAVANAFAEAFLERRRENIVSSIETAQALLRAQLEGLEQEAGAQPDTIITLRARLDQLEALAAMQQADYTLIQEAVVPEAPFSPQPVRDGILGLAVGLVLGVGLAFLLNFLDRRIKDEEAMTREFDLPVLSSIPAVGGKWIHKDKSLGARSNLPVGFPDGESALLEPFRLLRSNLQFFDVDKRLKVLLITSPLPQQGKTITSINLGISLALSGERVIIVEADLRRPMLHEYLSLSNEMGITNVLSGTHEFNEVLQLVPIEQFAPDGGAARRSGTRMHKNLYCITSGPLPPNPAELAGSAKMARILDEAAAAADYVIVDSPPILMAADALNLARHSDAVLVAARVNNTTREDAHQVREALARAGANVIGVVVTGVSPRAQYYYKYGYYASGAPEKETAGRV